MLINTKPFDLYQKLAAVIELIVQDRASSACPARIFCLARSALIAT